MAWADSETWEMGMPATDSAAFSGETPEVAGGTPAPLAREGMVIVAEQDGHAIWRPLISVSASRR